MNEETAAMAWKDLKACLEDGRGGVEKKVGGCCYMAKGITWKGLNPDAKKVERGYV